MALSNDEIEELVVKASDALKILQGEFGRKNVALARVRFPRGFIRTAAECRQTLPNIGTEIQRRNASYALMTSDIFRWIAVRTDLSGPALSLVVKESIAVIGVICEWLTKEGTRGSASGRPYAERTKKLVELNQINQSLKDELDWIWGVRCKEHFYDIETLEHDKYTRADYGRALTAYSTLRDYLVAIHGAA